MKEKIMIKIDTMFSKGMRLNDIVINIRENGHEKL